MKTKFDDIKSIIEHLDALTGDVDKTDNLITDLITKIQNLSDKNSEVSTQFSDITTKVSESVSYFNVASNKWTDSLNSHFQQIYDQINSLQASFKLNVESTFAGLLKIANDGLVSMDGYFQTVLLKLQQDIELFKSESKGFLGEVEKSVNLNYTAIQESITGFANNQQLLQASFNDFEVKINATLADVKSKQVETVKTLQTHFDKKFRTLFIVFSILMLILIGLNISLVTQLP